MKEGVTDASGQRQAEGKEEVSEGEEPSKRGRREETLIS